MLAGGGNSSVKTVERDVFGDPVDVLHVKGSGWDMATIERAGFAPLRLDPVARLAELPELGDARMARGLAAASLDPAAPAPSVESILHAVLPSRFVLHTHADAVLALTDTPGGAALVEEVYGDEVVVIPYVMPGFALARRCAEQFLAERHEHTAGMVLLNHGLFTFAGDARTGRSRHAARKTEPDHCPGGRTRSRDRPRRVRGWHAARGAEAQRAGARGGVARRNCCFAASASPSPSTARPRRRSG